MPGNATRPSPRWPTTSAGSSGTSRSARGPIRCGIERPRSFGGTRSGVAMSAAVVLLLGGSTAFYTSRLATERDRAQREAAKAAKVSEVLMGLLTGADPIANRADAGRAHRPRAARCGRRSRAAGARGTARAAGGDSHEAGSDCIGVSASTTRRSPCSKRRSRAGSSVFGAEHVRVAQTLERSRRRAGGARATTRRRQQHLEQALAMRRKLLGPEHADVAVTLVELGRVYQD